MTPPAPVILPAASLSETTLLALRPHPALILLRSQNLLLLLVALGAVAWWLAGLFAAPLVATLTLWIALAVMAVSLVWNLLVWAARGYELTNRRLIRTAGVLNRSRVEIPLERIQHTEVSRSWVERLLGLGSLGFSTAGSAWREMVWVNIERPHELMAAVRAAMEQRAGSPGDGSSPPAAGSAQSPLPRLAGDRAYRRPIPIIGLAGGIGAGKSEVARILEELGCFVIDSDKQAREALDRPEVRDELVRWWGRSILKDSGAVDRSEVARIVFGHEDQRRRLENLVHPLVRARRADLIAQATAAGARAAVVDAPLLFEAGVDQECDAVIFIDAPREVRLRRLRDNRGWSEAELDRRERAQLPLEEKRRRSTFTIPNTGARSDLASRIARVLETIEADN